MKVVKGMVATDKCSDDDVLNVVTGVVMTGV